MSRPIGLPVCADQLASTPSSGDCCHLELPAPSPDLRPLQFPTGTASPSGRLAPLKVPTGVGEASLRKRSAFLRCTSILSGVHRPGVRPLIGEVSLAAHQVGHPAIP